MLSLLAHSGDVFVVAPALVLVWWFGDAPLRTFAVVLAAGAVLSVAMDYAKDHRGLAVIISPDDAFKYNSFFQPYVKDAGNP